MTEQDVIGQLTGPQGGVVINPYVQRAHTAEMSAMQSRIAALELRIKELEKFEESYMAILEAHSQGTLHPAKLPKP